ncbi:MAG: Lpg1974 family pore-forming outer membrane protein [Rhabdochlamydiaceae bacterium]|nr:Lpg1974 family pore-forming outer membrane protein [Candidatus Amphrikana amoebophyrae]
MDKNILKKVPLAIVALTASASLYAGMDMDSRVSQLETQMKQARTTNEMGSAGANTAVARPDKDLTGFYIGAGFVYQQAKAGGTEYAYTDDSANTYPIKGDMSDINYKWDWGLNIMAGYNMPHDGMDLRLGYHYFDQSSNNSTSSGLNGTVVPLRSSSSIRTGTAGSFTACDKATSDYSLDMNLLDLQLGRDYFVSKMLSFRPYFGLVSDWIDQSQKTQYTGGSQLGSNTVEVNDKSNFWGMGPELGLGSKWFIGQGFSFFSDANASLLYGRFGVRHKEKYTDDVNQELIVNGNVHRVVPTAQLVMGLGYDIMLDDDSHHFGIRLGYNVEYYFFQNQMLKVDYELGNNPQFERTNESLGIHGITLDVVWSF